MPLSKEVFDALGQGKVLSTNSMGYQKEGHKLGVQKFWKENKLATPHNDGVWCSIEDFFSILLSVFLKLFHLFFEAFPIIAFAF
jgi:hypothetical protein